MFAVPSAKAKKPGSLLGLDKLAAAKRAEKAGIDSGGLVVGDEVGCSAMRSGSSRTTLGGASGFEWNRTQSKHDRDYGNL